MKKELIITVSGLTNTGKSRLTYILKNFLQEQGFDVEFNNILDFSNEIEFDKYMNNNIDDVIDNIKNNSKIILKEQQLNINK